MGDAERPRSLSRITNCSQISDSDYFDANENVTYGDSLTLLDTIAETQITLNLFMNNRFDLAEERMAELADKSMYHALGYNTILFIKAMLTCDKKDLEKSTEVCKTSCNVVLNFRQKQSLTESIFGSRAKHLTDDEIHAELVYAECLLLRAVLSFFHDDNFASFIKGALNIRTCYRLYKACEKTMNDNTIWEERDQRVRDQFEAGVKLGLGIFNLMISTLPSKVLRLLDFIGFGGDKQTGMNYLHRCSSMTSTLFSSLATMVLLTWHLVACFMFGTGNPDLPLCRRLLPSIMAKWPKGSITLYLRARLLLVSADVDSAIFYFNKSIESQDLYKQFHHGCYWELLFAHGYQQQWTKAANYARKLMTESKWSRCIYTYILCIFFAADETVETVKREETVALLAKKVDGARLRIAGKSIPIEKFCAKKALRYLTTKSLIFAHLEFIYFWNGFDILASNEKLLKDWYADIERTWEKNKNNADINDKCLYLFVRAICLRHMRSSTLAEISLREIISVAYAHKLTDFYYLYPNALYELALIKIFDGNRKEAEELLAEARKIKGYSLENKLHFRIHSAMENLGSRTPLN